MPEVAQHTKPLAEVLQAALLAAEVAAEAEDSEASEPLPEPSEAGAGPAGVLGACNTIIPNLPCLMQSVLSSVA